MTENMSPELTGKIATGLQELVTKQYLEGIRRNPAQLPMLEKIADRDVSLSEAIRRYKEETK